MKSIGVSLPNNKLDYGACGNKRNFNILFVFGLI